MRKTMTRMFTFLLISVLILSTTPAVSAVDDDCWTDYTATSFASGSGTAADPYVINTAQQLALLAQYANVQEYGYYDAHYILGADIDLSAHQWNPIGVVDETQDGGMYVGIGFDGVFDGKNHKVTGLMITEPTEGCYMYGLFGLNTGTVKNLTLSNAKICFNSADKGWISANGMGSDIRVGGLCAESQGSIRNCNVTNITIDATAVMSLRCGGALGSLNYGQVYDLHVTGSVSGNSGRAIEIGGVIGGASNNVTVENSGFVGSVKSQNNGTIEIEGLTEEGYTYIHFAGGFCGSAGRANANITMKNCYAEVDIDSVSITAEQDVGGFAGAIGWVYDTAVFENLVCRPTIKCNDSAVAIDETYFWRGEMGTWYSWQEDSTNWVYKNLMVLTADTVYTTNSATDYCQTTPYSLSETDISTLLFEELGFSDSIWTVGSSGMPKVKDQIVKIVLSAPTIQVSNNASTGKPVISWSKVDGAVKYELYQATSKNGTYKKIGTATGTSITNKSAVTGKMYYYKVKAVDANGNKSEFSNVVNRTCDIPQPVIKATNIASTGKVKLSWEPIEGAVKYELYRATSPNGTYTKIGTTKNSYIVNTSGVAGTLYYYKIRALHGTNSGAHSAFSNIVERSCDLAQPVVTVSLNSAGNPKLTWGTVEGAIKYRVYRATSKDGTYSLIYTTRGTTCTNIKNVVEGQTYYYKVRAYCDNSGATSAYSAIKYITAK